MSYSRYWAWPVFEFCEQVRYLLTHVATINDHIDRAMIKQKFTALKSFRQLLANSLLDHAWAGEAN